MRNTRQRSIRCILLAISIIVLTPLSNHAEEYLIGPGDILQISYWQQPELNQEVAVRQDGKITLAVIGEIQAAGLTASRLEQTLVERISRVNKLISQVVVTVKEYHSRNVFVGGQVVNPGLLYFEVIPDLWETIKQAGGPSEFADLSNITVLRSNEAGGGVVNVDLADILTSGELDRLPALHSGYTVTIHRLPEGLPESRFVELSQRRQAFYIYGNIAAPGRHPMDSEVDLLEALVLAGGPGPNADLEKVRVISKGMNGSVVRVIDLEKYGERGGPYRYLIQREDAVFVPSKKRGVFSGTWGAFRDLLALGGTVSSLILILNR